MCERRVWLSRSPMRQMPSRRIEEAIMKFMLRALAAMALVTLTADLSLGAVISVVRSHKIQGNKLGHERGQTPKSGQAHVTPKNNVIRSVTGPNGQKNAPPVLATATGSRSIADLRGSTSVPPIAALPPARFKPPTLALPKAPYAGINGTGIKHSLSASATLGGATTGKGTAALGGMGAPLKKH